MGCFVYLIFGSIKDVTVGPTAIMALLSKKHVVKLGEDLAVSESLLTSLADITTVNCFSSLDAVSLIVCS